MDKTFIKEFANANSLSDKITYHGYHRFYPYFLLPLKNKKNIRILELGYDQGFSIPLWNTYFNNPLIDAIDIKENPNDNMLNNYFKVNQDKNSELDNFVSSCTYKYDFIIDDASHIPTHQWNTLIRFFEVLNEGGVYIIEDIETNYWGNSETYGYQFDSRKFSLIRKLYSAIEYINQEFQGRIDLQKKLAITDQEALLLSKIEMITFGYNCVIITKKSKEFKQFYRNFNEYRFRWLVKYKSDFYYFVRDIYRKFKRTD